MDEMPFAKIGCGICGRLTDRRVFLEGPIASETTPIGTFRMARSKGRGNGFDNRLLEVGMLDYVRDPALIPDPLAPRALRAYRDRCARLFGEMWVHGLLGPEHLPDSVRQAVRERDRLRLEAGDLRASLDTAAIEIQDLRLALDSTRLQHADALRQSDNLRLEVADLRKQADMAEAYGRAMEVQYQARLRVEEQATKQEAELDTVRLSLADALRERDDLAEKVVRLAIEKRTVAAENNELRKRLGSAEATIERLGWRVAELAARRRAPSDDRRPRQEEKDEVDEALRRGTRAGSASRPPVTRDLAQDTLTLRSLEGRLRADYSLLARIRQKRR